MNLTTPRQVSRKTQRGQYIYGGTGEAKTGYIMENKTTYRMPPGRPPDEWNSRMRECGVGLDIPNIRLCQDIPQKPYSNTAISLAVNQ